MLARGFFDARRAAIATVTALSFSCFTTGSALAHTPAAAAFVAESSTGGAPLPVPTPLGFDAPVQAPAAPQGESAPAPVADAPSHVPAPMPAGLGKIVLFLLAVVGIAILVLLVVGAIALYDLVTNNE